MFSFKAEELVIFALVLSPAFLGLGALAGGVFLLVKRPMRGTADTLVTVVGALLLLVSLGVGACYGALFLFQLLK